MSANFEAKKSAVEEIKELISSSKSIVLVDYKGITVSDDTALRKEMRTNNVTYKVIKNTLFKKACEQLGITGLDEALNGTTAFAFSGEESGDIVKCKVEAVIRESVICNEYQRNYDE